ncbi:MAG: SEC-C metal-binding domain-containing protein, partial [Candidatus Contendobacter sp.]
REAFEMFQALVQRIHQEAVGFLVRAQFQAEPAPIPEPRGPAPAALHFEHAAAPAPSLATDGERVVDAVGDADQISQEVSHTPFVRDGRKVGRNEPCPCGSGKKYKHCHGQLD